MKIKYDHQNDGTARIKRSFSGKKPKAELLKCHTLSENLTICFYKEFVAFYDKRLRCTNQIDWRTILPFKSAELCRHSIAQNFSSTQPSSEKANSISSKSFISSVYIENIEDFKQTETKSVF